MKRLQSDSLVGSCDCLTKTPEVKYHKPGCKYRLISERDEAREQIEAMREAIKEAIPCLDTDRDLTDEEIQNTSPKLIARRAALRKLQPFLKP